MIINSLSNWTQANALCQSIYQTDLITIGNTVADASASNLCGTFCSAKQPLCGCWIGGYRNANQTRWHWKDGTPIGTYGFHSNGTATGIDPPWYYYKTNVTLDHNAYILYIETTNTWKWRISDGNGFWYPMCAPTSISTTMIPNAITFNPTTSIPTQQFKVYRTGTGHGFLNNNTYIAFLLVLVGLLCIVGVVIFYNQRKEGNKKDVYKIAKVASPRVEAISKVRSVEYSSSSPQNGVVNIKDDNMVNIDINNCSSIIEDNDETLKIKQWLTDDVRLPQYVSHFVENGYDQMDFIHDISDKAELDDIGIKKAGHKTRIFAQIKMLQPSAREYTIYLSESKHEELEEEVKRGKKKHKNNQFVSMSHLSSLHITDEWKMDHGRLRADESLTVCSVAAKGQYPEHNRNISDHSDGEECACGNGKDLSDDHKEHRRGKTDGYMMEEISSSEDSTQEASKVLTPTYKQ